MSTNAISTTPSAPKKEGVLDRVQQAPLRVGQPVFTVQAGAAVQPEEGGYAVSQLLAVALRDAEGRHHGVSPAVYGGLDPHPQCSRRP